MATLTGFGALPGPCSWFVIQIICFTRKNFISVEPVLGFPGQGINGNPIGFLVQFHILIKPGFLKENIIMDYVLNPLNFL